MASFRRHIYNLNAKLMLTCHEVTRLISQQAERPLPWNQRVRIRLHLLLCLWCRRYQRHIAFLRGALRTMPERDCCRPSARLSEEARERLKQALRSNETQK